MAITRVTTKSLPEPILESISPKPLVFPHKHLVAYWPSGDFPILLQNSFERHGYWVDVTRSIEVFLELAKRHPIDLALYQVSSLTEGWELPLSQLIQESMQTRFAVMMKSPRMSQVVLAMKLGAAGVFETEEVPEKILPVAGGVQFGCSHCV